MLAREEQPGHLTEGEPEGEARRRPMPHAAERLRQLAIGDGFGRGSVVDALRALVLEFARTRAELGGGRSEAWTGSGQCVLAGSTDPL